MKYARITLTDGARFILRIERESEKIIVGYEVNLAGDEIVPPGFDNRLRIIGRECVRKIVPMRMNNHYASLEVDRD